MTAEREVPKTRTEKLIDLFVDLVSRRDHEAITGVAAHLLVNGFVREVPDATKKAREILERLFTPSPDTGAHVWFGPCHMRHWEESKLDWAEFELEITITDPQGVYDGRMHLVLIYNRVNQYVKLDTESGTAETRAEIRQMIANFFTSPE